MKLKVLKEDEDPLILDNVSLDNKWCTDDSDLENL